MFLWIKILCVFFLQLICIAIIYGWQIFKNKLMTTKCKTLQIQVKGYCYLCLPEAYIWVSEYVPHPLGWIITLTGIDYKLIGWCCMYDRSFVRTTATYRCLSLSITLGCLCTSLIILKPVNFILSITEIWSRLYVILWCNYEHANYRTSRYCRLQSSR